MKEIDELNLPEDLSYTEDHEWIQTNGDTVKIGISDYAQDQLGDIVFVELPEVGDTFNKGDEFGTVESVKAVSELYIPISGEITGLNKSLEDAPEVVNTDPYDDGWMIEVQLSNPQELDELLDRNAYIEMLKGTE